MHSAIALLFSGEEAYGKYVDLYTNHTAYNNLKNIGKRLGYLQYLDSLLSAQNGPVHRELPKETRLTKDYESCVEFCANATLLLKDMDRYIQNLYNYLLSFSKRTQPLVDVDTRQREAEVEFDTKWEAGEIAGWEESSAKTQTATNGAEAGIWCSACKYFYHETIMTPIYDIDLKAKRTTPSKLFMMPISLQKNT